MHTHVAWSHELWLAADPRSAGAVRAFVSQHLYGHERPHLLEPVRLVSSELATNALVHAGAAFVVTLLERDATVVLTVEDDRTDALPNLETAPVTAEGGRGLWLVDVLSDDWGISTDRRGFKGVWASFATGEEHAHGSECTCRASHPSAQSRSTRSLRVVR
jgi:anti-sigma regulatory factor (Ser/Thr protein kinase)